MGPEGGRVYPSRGALAPCPSCSGSGTGRGQSALTLDTGDGVESGDLVTIGLGLWIFGLCVRAVGQMLKLATWLWYQRKLDAKRSAFPPAIKYVGVICPACFAETAYDHATGQYRCQHHGVVAGLEDTYYATRN